MKPLHIYYGSSKVGTFIPDETFRLSFSYDSSWLKDKGAFAISLALPLSKEVYDYPKGNVFLENLLPEEKVRRSVENAFGLPKDNPYHFLKEFGEDLAGAFTIRTEEDDSSAPSQEKTPLSLEYVQSAIQNGQNIYQSIAHDHGARFSLAGAQDKFCVIYEDNQLYLSHGEEPSTHIAKVNLDFRNSQTVFNEFFCMSLAKAIGLNVPDINLISKPEPILLVKRYDRIVQEGTLIRLHQEDFCQAHGVSSSLKYEEKGGPAASDNFNLMKRHSQHPIKDLDAYLNWISFNLIIGNNDSHSKNLSFIYQEKKVSLAPFYDLLSTAVYGNRFNQSFAIKIGGIFRYDHLRAEHIALFEKELGIRKGKFKKNFAKIATEVKNNLETSLDKLKTLAPQSTIGERICESSRSRLIHLKNHGSLS